MKDQRKERGLRGFDSSAGPQALGYLYQVRYALLVVLSGVEDRAASVESLDDVTFEENGSPAELLQLKHHARKANLSDSSEDLWKTIRIWSNHTIDGRVDPRATALVLVTTATAPVNSIASLLRPERRRDVSLALTRLERVARSSQNKRLQSSFRSFLALSAEVREALVSSIHVSDQAPGIDAAELRIKELLKPAVLREHRDGLYERLEGWWFGRVVAQMRAQTPTPISGFEVHDKVRAIADQFRPSALPIDFLEAKPDSIDPECDSRSFVQQLRAIAVRNRRIEKAILDYYRAYEQRSRWTREQLLGIDELCDYEERLVDEWERYVDALVDSAEAASSSDRELQFIGRQVLNWMELEADIRIRSDVIEAYVMRGSYHMLANEDEPRVWWHPHFIESLRSAAGGQELLS